MYRCDKCGYETYVVSNYDDGLCISCREGIPVPFSEEEMKEVKETEKKSIVMVIAFLRMLTGGQGQACVEVFDGGSGGGFYDSSVYIDHLRDGRAYSRKEVDNVKDLYKILEYLTQPYSDEPKGFYPSLKRYYEETLDEIEKGEK